MGAYRRESSLRKIEQERHIQGQTFPLGKMQPYITRSGERGGGGRALRLEIKEGGSVVRAATDMACETHIGNYFLHRRAKVLLPVTFPINKNQW